MTDTLTRVPAPWTPLQAAQHGDEITLDVVGRTYRLGTHAALPVSIQTAGEEILAAPVRLVGRLAGQPVTWIHPTLSLLQAGDERAVLCGTLETGGVIVSASVKADYDGVLRFDLAVTPYLGNMKGSELAYQLEQLWLEIPLKASRASLYTYWPLAGGELKVYEPVNSGAVPVDGFTLPYKPFVWLGWEDGGLGCFTESDAGWQHADPARAIEVMRDGETTVLRLRLLDSLPQAWAEQADGWYHPNPPVTFSIGLQATPAKPMETNPLAHRIVHLSYYEPLESMRIEEHPRLDGKPGTLLDQVVESGADVVALHEAWNGLQNYWICNRADEITATVAACHARGLKVIPYFGYELSTLAPEWAELHDRVLVQHPDGRFEGGWQRYPPQRDYMVCYGSEWQERWLAGIAWMLDAYGFDGLYLDGTTMPWGCANTAHGCGYRHPDGSIGATYPIFRVREMFARLYALISARGGVITAHQSSCCLTPTLQYCHSYWDGEHIGGGFKHDGEGHFPLATFRAEFMGRNYGIRAEFLSGDPEAVTYALLHNVMVRPGAGGMLDIVASVWRALDAFGVADAHWLPYWESASLVTTDAPHVHVSAYRRDGRALLAVGNLAAETAVDAALHLTGDYRSARDAVTGESLGLRDGSVTVHCGAMGWRLIEIA